MTWLNRLPTRASTTAAFAVVMALLLLAISVSVYWAMGAALLDELDSGLRFRAATIAPTPQRAAVETPNSKLEERGEAFDQLLTADGRGGPAPGFRRRLFSPRRSWPEYTAPPSSNVTSPVWRTPHGCSHYRSGAPHETRCSSSAPPWPTGPTPLHI
jgi:hypothetical protein